MNGRAMQITNGSYDMDVNADGSINSSCKGFSSSASQTRPNDTTAYAALDVAGTNAATNMVFSNVSSLAGGNILIAGAALEIDVSAIPSGMATFRLHLYNAAPTAIADNSAYNLPSADRTKYLGYIEIPTPIDIGDTCWSEVSNLSKFIKLATGSTTLYGILQTVAAFTPTAQCVKTVTIYTIQV